MSRNDQNSEIEWTIAREIAHGTTRSLDARVSAHQNEKNVKGYGCAILAASLATATYSILEVKYGFPTPRDRLVGIAAIGMITLYVWGFFSARYRRSNQVADDSTTM